MNSNNPTFFGQPTVGLDRSHLDSLRDVANSKGDKDIINETISTYQTSINLNTLYPPRTDPASIVGVAIGQKVYCPTIGVMYTKITASLWASSPIAIV